VIMRLLFLGLGGLVVISACSGSGAESAPTTSVWASTSTTLGIEATTSSGSSAPSIVDPAFPINFLDGIPLETPSELLIVAGDSLIVMDAGVIERIEGLPETKHSNSFWTQQAGNHAAIHCLIGCQGDDLFILPKGESTAHPIGSGFPTPGIGGVWIKSFSSDDACTLAKVEWTGQTLHPEREFDCRMNLIEETSLGLVTWTEPGYGPIQGGLIDPSSLSPVLEVGEIHGVIENEILYRDGDGFVLLDTESGSETRLEFPTDVGLPDYGDLSPDGKYLAISFKNPAWPGPRQRLDTWLLDTDTHEWTRLPSMPVAASLKGTGLTWTADGRIVMYGAFDDVGVALATFTPGDRYLKVRQVNYSPAASIVAWCTGPECES